MKEKYIDLMEVVFCAYTDEQIDSYIKKTKENGLCEFLSDFEIKDKHISIANRNGHYKAFAVCGRDKISLKIKIS